MWTNFSPRESVALLLCCCLRWVKRCRARRIRWNFLTGPSSYYYNFHSEREREREREKEREREREREKVWARGMSMSRSFLEGGAHPPRAAAHTNVGQIRCGRDTIERRGLAKTAKNIFGIYTLRSLKHSSFSPQGHFPPPASVLRRPRPLALLLLFLILRRGQKRCLPNLKRNKKKKSDQRL